MDTSCVYSFGPFRLDAARRQLTRDGELVAVPPKAFDTLLILIQARDRVVTKEELFRRLWPDVAVEDASLTQQIFVIRKALETTSGNAEYIATIPRSGYRFVQPVREVTADSSEKAMGSQRRFPGLVGLGIVVVVVVAAATLLRTRSTIPAKMDFDVLPPDGLSLSNSIALSPDATYLAFTAAADDAVPSLWLRSIASDDVRRVEGTDGALYPFWSPDSASIGFFAAGKLKRVDVVGGPPRIVSDRARSPRGGAWGERGAIVFAPDGGSVLYRVPASGGAAEPATMLDPGHHEADHRWPVFLPGGTHVVFMTRNPAAAQRHALAVARVDGPPQRHQFLTNAIPPGSYIDGHLLFVRGRTLLMRPFDRNRLELRGPESMVRTNVWRSLGLEGLQGCTAAAYSLVACRTGATETQLVWVDRNGHEIGTLDAAYAANPELSPNDKMIAFGMYDEAQEHDVLSVLDLSRRPFRRLTPGNMEEQVWSPDGTRIAFGAEVDGAFDLHVIETTGSGSEQVLLHSKEWKFPKDWSRDDKWLLYSDGGKQLLALSLVNNGRTVALLRSGETAETGRFSPNVHWIAYGSQDSGRSEVYVRAFPGSGDPWRVSSAGGSEPRWRGDGREIYFVRPDRRLVAVSVEQENGQLRFSGERVLFDAPTYHTGYHYSYDVTKDGERFLVTRVRDPGRIKVLVNWRGQ